MRAILGRQPRPGAARAAHVRRPAFGLRRVIVPLAVLNHLLICWVIPDVAEDETVVILYWIVCLVMIEAPLATAPMTLYLGQALFVEKPNRGLIVRDFASSLPQLVLLQVAVLRDVDRAGGHVDSFRTACGPT